MKTADLLPIVLLGVGVFIYMQSRKQQVMQYPPVTPGTPDWTYKVKNIVEAAGGVADALFGPNGPFRNLNKEQVNAALAKESTPVNAAQWIGKVNYN